MGTSFLLVRFCDFRCLLFVHFFFRCGLLLSALFAGSGLASFVLVLLSVIPYFTNAVLLLLDRLCCFLVRLCLGLGPLLSPFWVSLLRCCFVWLHFPLRLTPWWLADLFAALRTRFGSSGLFLLLAFVGPACSPLPHCYSPPFFGSSVSVGFLSLWPAVVVWAASALLFPLGAWCSSSLVLPLWCGFTLLGLVSVFLSLLFHGLRSPQWACPPFVSHLWFLSPCGACVSFCLALRCSVSPSVPFASAPVRFVALLRSLCFQPFPLTGHIRPPVLAPFLLLPPSLALAFECIPSPQLFLLFVFASSLLLLPVFSCPPMGLLSHSPLPHFTRLRAPLSTVSRSFRPRWSLLVRAFIFFFATLSTLGGLAFAGTLSLCSFCILLSLTRVSALLLSSPSPFLFVCLTLSCSPRAPAGL